MSVFGNLETPLVPTCHGDCFSVPPGGTGLAEGDILLRDGGYRRIPMAYRHGTSYGFQFEPQLTPEELEVWNREMMDDYRLMGERFDAEEEAARHLREFRAYWPVYQRQTQAMLKAFLREGGIGVGMSLVSTAHVITLGNLYPCASERGQQLV